MHNFQGAAVDDKKHQVIPLICKELNFLIIHTAQMMISFDVTKNIRQSSKLKSFISDNLPKCKVVISTPTLWTDDGKAALTVNQLTNHLRQLDRDIIDNRNINTRNLANKSLHLHPTGASCLLEK